MDVAPDIKFYIEAVHRLSNLGAVFTQPGRGISHEGFEAEWRDIILMSIEGDQFNRCEIFDEADVDAAIARFDELSRPAPQLENAASRVYERSQTYFTAGDWDALAAALADKCYTDDRRRVVGAGVRHGPDAAVEDSRAIADVGLTNMSTTVIATRGQRLALTRAHYSGTEPGPEAFHAESLAVVEIDADHRIAAVVVFELDDIDAAFEELDARYLAGEAADHAQSWSVITRAFAAVNRHEVPPTAPDWVDIDHRRGAPFGHGDLAAIIATSRDITPDLSNHVECVHLLNDFGALFTQISYGSSYEGFGAEWRMLNLVTIEGDLMNRCELFDEADVDSAFARFEELQPRTPRLENAASQVVERIWACFMAREWHAIARLLAQNVAADDRRRVVNSGALDGRDSVIAAISALAEVGVKHVVSEVIAIRGEHLVLSRTRSAGSERPEAFHVDALDIVEIDAHERVASHVAFDVDDIDAGLEELDARYLAGEAAPHAHTWSVIARGLAAFNRRELPGFTPDSVNIDHRRARGFAPGDLTAYIGATWDLAPDVSAYAEAVHRLSNLGAVFAHAVTGTSQDGFYAEWREICLATVEGDLISRIEMFDEADVDAALAKFDELNRPAKQLENAASRVVERFPQCFAARDWNGMAELYADDFVIDDRRRVVNAGIRHGREAEIEDLRAAANVGFTNVTWVVIATRGERLVLTRARFSGRDQRPDAFAGEVLHVVEIDADDRTAAVVVFDTDDFDSAFAELDARYLAGEAAAHAHTWSVIARGFAALNRHEVPPTAPDLVNVDHRRGTAYAPGELISYVRAGWDLGQNIWTYPEVVHRLSEHGAVVTHAAHGISQEGFEAEWRGVDLLTVDGDMVNRCETFDEADLDAAVAKFDELSRPAPRRGNTASRVYGRLHTYFAARNWDAMAAMLADDSLMDDRRRVVGAGVRRGRNATMAAWRAIAEIRVTNIAAVAIATRGTRLALCRTRAGTSSSEAFDVEALQIVDIDADERMVALVSFDPNDIGAAFEELDARYLAGEAATHEHTWSVVAEAFAAVNRHELPGLTPDWANIDHRRASAFAPGDMAAYTQATFEQLPDATFYVEAVHRLSDLGAVVTQAAHGTSQEGFEAEWREIGILIVEGDLLGRYELFDEADIDAAIGRFEELHPQTRRLENAASRVAGRVWTCFAAREWAAMAELVADDICTDDRRRVVNAGIRHGRDDHLADMRVLAEMGANITSTVIATRGERLALNRICSANQEEFGVELLSIIEVGADNRALAGVSFDPNDIDAALEELDARYLVGEAADYAHTWSAVAGAFAAINRHEFPPTTPDWVNVDHRRATPFAPNDLSAVIDTSMDLTPDLRSHVETVHLLGDFGAVVTQVSYGTSHEGFEAEWRFINLLTFEGDLINRVELFDEADLDAALARFDELNRPAA
jgi:hypothetical protein